MNNGWHRLNKSLTTLMVLEIFILIKTVCWSLLTGAEGDKESGMILLAAIVQGTLTIYFLKKTNKKLSFLMAWLTFFSCMSVLFIDPGNFITIDISSIKFGILELLLVLNAIVFIARFHNYKYELTTK